MRITARLDDETEAYIEQIKQSKGLKTTTDVLKYALRDTAESLSNQHKSGDKMKALLDSDFIGCGNGPEDLSVNYKEYLHEGLKEKHGNH